MDKRIAESNFISSARQEFKVSELSKEDKEKLAEFVGKLEDLLTFFKTDVRSVFSSLTEKFTSGNYTNLKLTELKDLPEYQNAVKNTFEKNNSLISSANINGLLAANGELVEKLRDRNIYLETLFGEIIRTAANKSFSLTETTTKLQAMIDSIKNITDS